MVTKQLIVRTSTIEYKGLDRLNITAKHGKEPFSPGWRLVIEYKYKEISEKEYTDVFIQRMRWSYANHKKEWAELLAMGQVTLCCSCQSHAFCHRLLLKDIIRKICDKKGIEFIDGGEIVV